MSVQHRKKLIEVAMPLEAINAASAREKSIRHGHPATLHLWWARRPLAAARAVLFAQLVDDPSSWPDVFPNEEAQNQERQRLFRLIEDLVRWENSNNAIVINAARREIARSHARSSSSEKAKGVLAEDATPASINEYLATELPAVHDPFAGGGTIPLEAQRLGLRAIATDLNPVAVLINKALVEFPSRFNGLPPINPAAAASPRTVPPVGTEGLADDVRYYGNWMRQEAKKRIGHLYPDVDLPAEYGGGRATVIAWLWARTVASPNPAVQGIHVPLVSSFWLSMKPDRRTWVEPVVDQKARSWRFRICTGEPKDMAALEIGTRAGRNQDFVCLLSGAPITRDYIRDEGKAGRLKEALMAVVAEGKRGRLYVAPSADHERIAMSASKVPAVSEARETFLAGATPSRAMITGGVCSAYGLSTFGHLFTSRQLVALLTITDLIDEASALASRDGSDRRDRNVADYANALAVYFACVLDRCADFWSSLATWSAQPKNELVISTFRRQALPMTWDFGEVNPFSRSGGNLEGSIESVAKALTVCPTTTPGVGVSQVFQADAMQFRPRGAVLSTDPPYYDNISYAELSDFFFAWMRRALRSRFPQEMSTMLTPKDTELIATPYRHGGKAEAERFFIDGMSAFFQAANLGAAEDWPITVYYAFKQAEASRGGASTGWETFLQAIVVSGLVVDGTWPLRTERATRTTGLGTNALASSVVLVCRKLPADAPSTSRGDFRRLLRKELPDALKKLQQGNIAPVDVAQASIGPGMAIFSRHKHVAEADGTAMTVRSALQLINEVLDEYLASGEGDFDPDTRFAITWYEQHGWEAGAFGEAETLAKARNVSVSGVVAAGICHSAAGKVRILKRPEMRPLEYDPANDERPTIWEFTQHMIRLLETEGEESAARLLKKLGSATDATRELAYRLYNTCERKKWADDARSYNGLILAWPELEKLAAKVRDDEPPEPSTGGGKSKKAGKKAKATKRGQQNLFPGADE